MIYFSIDTNKKQNGQTSPSFNEHQNTLINNVPTPNNDVHIKYHKKNIDQNNNITTLHNPAPTTNNNTRTVTVNWTPKSVREFKYNILLNKFDEGYPETFTYAICPQKLATVFSLGSSRHISVTQNVTTSYPKNHDRLSVIENNNNDIFKCGDETFTSCTLDCPPGTFADPVSCICTSSPPLCVPLTPEPCNPTVEFTALKHTIQGYAFYVSDPKTYTYESGVMSINSGVPYTVPVPDIGNIEPTCFGGHICNRTIFQPALIVDDKKILANKTINLDNLKTLIDMQQNPSLLIANPTIKPPGSLLTPKEAHPHEPLAEFEQQRIDQYNELISQMGPDPFGYNNSNDLSRLAWSPIVHAARIFDRSDTFTFTLTDPSVLANALLTLDCTSRNCHNSVTFIVLVGERLHTNEKVLLFASCVAPSNVDAGKLIGVIDCPDGPPDPCYNYNTTSSINIIP